jgi:hypothetical protein
LVSPRITNKLKGSLGEIYYKEFCDQRGWAYTSLENIYEYMNPDWVFIFKKGFHRIKIKIPEKIRDEVSELAKPTNLSESSPSFVFDFLACKVGDSKNYAGVQNCDHFAWVESKTGPGIFSGSQVNAMSKIKISLAIFKINDVLEAPENIDMGWDIKSGKEWLEELDPVDNELFELANKDLTRKLKARN